MNRMNNRNRILLALAVVGFLGATSAVDADGFRPEGFLFFKEIKPPGNGVYGRVLLDEEVVRYSGAVDVVPTQGGKPLPFIRRAVPAPQGVTGVRAPKVIFKQKRRKGTVYNLELPPPPAGTEYVWLSLDTEGTFETGIHLSVGETPRQWRSLGQRSVFRYRGSTHNRVRFRGGESRYLRVEFEGKEEFTFPEAGYEPIRRVSEFKADIGRADFKMGTSSDAKETVLYLENEKRRRIHRLVFRFAEERFNRRLQIQVMEDDSRSYKDFMSASLMRKKGEAAEQVIDLRRATSGALRFVVENGSNEPLRLEHVEVWSPLEEIVFELPPAAKATGPMRLYYGNRYLTALRFDLQNTFDPAAAMARVELGPHQKNPDFGYSLVEPPLSTWVIRILFYLGLIGVALPAYRVFSRYAERTGEKTIQGQAAEG